MTMTLIMLIVFIHKINANQLQLCNSSWVASSGLITTRYVSVDFKVQCVTTLYTREASHFFDRCLT